MADHGVVGQDPVWILQEICEGTITTPDEEAALLMPPLGFGIVDSQDPLQRLRRRCLRRHRARRASHTEDFREDGDDDG
eukprot:CAMPEP_0176023412 /NCGR_PEP_ID=MMETSP0120_2-20121206/11422_1 /TAXON_ID=160619 /ORGANISM="Kryptoperidinium foliaceum, Strain CCMP 1326" /LENGTH=78 /DNA_ID=CAMNT_0017356577 /DNA_START=226 /DNA_END=458 /DNA_ORIENTATION=-